MLLPQLAPQLGLSTGSSAGTVCVLANFGMAGRQAVQALADRLQQRQGQAALIFEGSSAGAEVFQTLELRCAAAPG